MTLEKISDFLGSPGSRDYLRRIYLAQELENSFKKVITGDYRVIVSASRVIVECRGSVLSQALKQQQRRFYSILKNSAPELYRQSYKIFFRIAKQKG